MNVKSPAKRNVSEIITKNLPVLFSDEVDLEIVIGGFALYVIVGLFVGTWLGVWVIEVGMAVGERCVGVNAGRIRNLSPT